MTGGGEARVLAVALQKGGVGKTTSAVNLAAEMSQLGLRVLLVDLDQQANATDGLGITVGPDDGTTYEVLAVEREDRLPLKQVIQSSEFGPDVAPAALALRKLERTGLGAGGQGRLRTELEKVSGDYDIVIIDCPPSLGELTTAAFTAAHSILATVSPGPDELKALSTMENTVLDVQEGLNPDVDIRFVLATRFDYRPQLSKDVRRQLIADWPDEYIGEISSTVRVSEAAARQLPVSVYAPDNPAAKDYRAAARTIAERMNLHV
ncbi:ParA family protein [Prescottella subtropica]|uniref:ParA family protein n=1 Tax=Prescottella subtropica TaxID=2545757 RepID=UPI0010F6F303|nr:ParA family protein [Prescottella subtropica]